MKINHNIPALRTLNQLNKVNDKGSKTMLRLSSGLRINSAADDAAGLAISQKMDTQIRGLKQANRNAMDGISMIQTAEGAYNEIHAMLQRMREITVQGANGTYDDRDKQTIQDEMMQLQEEIIAIQQRTEFNKKKLLDGSHDKFMLQVGANENQSMKITGADMNLDDVLTSIYGISTENGAITLGDLPDGTTIDVNGEVFVIGTTAPAVTTVPASADSLVVIKLPATPPGTTVNGFPVAAGEKVVFKTGTANVTFNQVATPPLALNSGASVILPIPNTNNNTFLDISDNEAAGKSLVKIDKAIETASKIRAKLGAYQNRLEHTVSNLGVSEENLTASLSRIQDADMALEMSTYTQQNILSQAATAMLAQANQRPQQILQLLQR
ncbi:flagellin N-terminal helical domain-containing protein [Cellulosilyticum sp. I15G10I2]|uniref:flagellin N-terminal helical domain-containing protein n=1 Tax=Cellulosilyticum sp. I15G10I2 TaxID=1892843 RepID=UPI00085C3AB2|nr:flagellin [Cellulosilyticum sp. I15G10I2]